MNNGGGVKGLINNPSFHLIFFGHPRLGVEMGNCLAVEAATVVIEHPGGRVERVYWSLSASQVMEANPGHYVALIITSTNANSSANGIAGGTATVKQLKLLRPDDTLHIGHVYRLVSFEDVLKEFASKKHVKLSSRLLAKHEEKSSAKRGRRRREKPGGSQSTVPESSPPAGVDRHSVQGEPEVVQGLMGSSVRRRRGGGPAARHGQWRPALQSIAEFGS